MYFDIKTSRHRRYVYLRKKVPDGRGGYRTETLASLGNLEGLQEEFSSDPAAFLHRLSSIFNRLDEPDYEAPVPLLAGDEIQCFGQAYIRWALEKMGLIQLMEWKQESRKIWYSLPGLLTFLVSSRFIQPGSLAFEHRHRDILPCPSGFSLQDVYNGMDILDETGEGMEETVWNSTRKIFDPDGKEFLLLFDGSNFYWFIRQPDEDIKDEEGNIIFRAYRTNGFSKENRALPLTGLGLFVRVGGMPVSWSMQPGKRMEISYLPEEIKKIMETLEPGRFVLVCDRGNWSGQVISTVKGRDREFSSSSNNYIIGKGIRRASASLKEFALSDEGWEKYPYTNSRGKVRTVTLKSRIEEQPINYRQDGVVHREVIRQKDVIHYSIAYASREGRKRLQLLEKARKLVLKKGALSSRLNSGPLRLVRITVGNRTVKSADNREVVIDEAKVDREGKLDGYYLITSSLDEEGAGIIFREYRELKFVEDDFRILKSFLELRPVYVRTEEHVRAHMDICILALCVLRFFQHQCQRKFSAEELIEGIRSFQAVKTAYGFRILGTNEVIGELEEISGIRFEHQNMSQKTKERCFGLYKAVEQLQLF